jgi:hypothetical protein
VNTVYPCGQDPRRELRSEPTDIARGSPITPRMKEKNIQSANNESGNENAQKPDVHANFHNPPTNLPNSIQAFPPTKSQVWVNLIHFHEVRKALRRVCGGGRDVIRVRGGLSRLRLALTFYDLKYNKNTTKLKSKRISSGTLRCGVVV